MHLAQLNVGRLRAPMDDPLIDDFRTNLEPINALAETSPGFVWRLQDEAGDATGIKPFGDELEIVNLTVWESIDALAQPIVCLWWIPEGTVPTVDDAIERLEHLRAHGATPTAFTFRHRFEPDGDGARLGSDRDTCPA